MALRFALLIIFFIGLIFCIDYILPKLINRYKKYRELKEKEKRQKAFKKKMKELFLIDSLYQKSVDKKLTK